MVCPDEDRPNPPSEDDAEKEALRFSPLGCLEGGEDLVPPPDPLEEATSLDPALSTYGPAFGAPPLMP